MLSSFFESVPKIIEASAKGPLALGALIVLALCFLAFFYFREAKEITRAIIFIFVGIGAFLLLLVIFSILNPAPVPPATPPPGGPVTPEATTPSPTSKKARLPGATLGTPVVRNGVAGPRGPGISISVPGSVQNGQGQAAQLVIGFTFPNGAPVFANPQETQFRTVDGLVATGTPQFPLPSDDYDLKSLSAFIPYFAFNMIPTGGYTRIDLWLTASLYLNNIVIARSPTVPFFFYW